MSRPAWSILNPAKRYYNSADTDVKRTFARIRSEQMKEKYRGQIVKIRPTADDAILMEEESWRRLLK
jgi:secreted PhoX family phosphatase